MRSIAHCRRSPPLPIPDRSPGRHGVALLEVVVSASAAAVLFAGMATAVMLSLRAGDSSIGPYSKCRSAAEAAAQITRELQHATAFNSTISNATRVEFTMPDQNGDGAAETVRYSWSGAAGAPLERRFNGGVAETILPSVQSLSFRYLTRTVPPAPVAVEGSEAQYLNQTTSPFFTLWSNITASNSYGEYFAPTLPTDAVSWRITRVQIALDTTSTSQGIPLIQVRKADQAKAPTSEILGQAIAAESDFTGAWHEVSFPAAGPFKPSEGACIVIADGNGTSEAACSVRVGFFSTSSPSTHALISSNGTSWTAMTSSDLWVRVWGKSTTETPGTGVSRYFRTGVDVTIQTGPSASTAVTTSVQTVNQPEVAAP